MRILRNKRFLFIWIALVLAAGGTVFVTVFAADPVVTSKVTVDYEDGRILADSVSQDTVATVSDRDVIGGSRSLLIYSCDMSWENLSLADYTMAVEFKIKCDSSFQGRFDLCLDTEGVNGDGQTVLSVTHTNGVLSLLASDRQVYELSYNTVYKIQVSIQRGSPAYRIAVNGVALEVSGELAGSTYGINTVRFKMDKSGESSYVLLDDFRIYSQGQTYPQPYSAQSTGEIPEISIPQTADPEKLALYINATRIYFAQDILLQNDMVYVPGKRLFESVGIDYQWDQDSKSVTITNDNINMIFSAGSNIATINGNNLVLTASPILYGDEIYVPLNLINEALNAKVWWDESANLIVITTGEAKTDNVLRNIGGKFYMNGEPYYEISFLYEELARNIWAAYRENGDAAETSAQYQEAERVLSELHELGFRSVRTYMWDDSQYRAVQSSADREIYFKSVSAVMDLCDAYEIRLIPCLGLNSKMFVTASYVENYGWVAGNETAIELVVNPESASRYDMYNFLDEFIKRFKERDTVLMWELCDGANLNVDCGATTETVTYSLLQLGQFYSDCVQRIQALDPSRLISGGDGMLRPAQWHLFSAVMQGVSEDWSYDSAQERLKAIALLTERLDVISVHAFGVGITTNAESYYSDEEGNKVQLTLLQILNEAKQMGKVLYNGATNGMVDYTVSENSAENLLNGQNKYLDFLIESGIQLSHWQLNNGETMGTAFFEENALSAAVANANGRLKQRYVFNKAYGENTDQSWSDKSFDVFDPKQINPGHESIMNLTLFYGIMKIVGAVAVTVLLLFVILFSMKQKENSLKRGKRENG